MRTPLSLLAGAALTSAATAAHAAPFHLRSGDRVVFYGDSITEQRLYTTFVETFVVTRFPSLEVRFVHAGRGADRVTGGFGGATQTRLGRDVIAHRPSVVTVMLGMNDGRYRAFDQAIFDRYATGYREILESLRGALPDVRITAIAPSPFDEITRPPPPERVGYNGVLQRFGGHLRGLAARERLHFADLNGELLEVLRKVNGKAPAIGKQIVPDAVHPAAAGHLVMAGSLLAAWNAPALVSAITIDAAGKRVGETKNAKVWGLDAAPGGLRFTVLDAALPFPIDGRDPVMAEVVSAARLVERFDQQPLRVTGLPKGEHALRIDGEQVGVWSAAALASGVNLATLETPMRRQAAEVHALTLKHNDVHFLRQREVGEKLAGEAAAAPALAALDGLEEALVRKQRALARPLPRRYEIVRVDPAAAAVPGGLQPLLGTGRLGTVLLAAERARDVEVFLEIEDGAGDLALLLRHDGIGRGYRVSLDARPDGGFGRVQRIGIAGARPSPATDWQSRWRRGGWNAVRVRIEGDRARTTVWLNGAELAAFSDDVFAVAAGPEEPAEGVTALILPDPAAGTRVRNVAVRKLR